jgi:molybdopterin-guanine dinucleotide biosynthesis protein A
MSEGPSPKEQEAPLLGIVLCGGESKRMGRDKGLLPDLPSSLTWAGRIAGLMEGVGIPYVLSVNVRQRATYGALFGEERLVADHLDIPGPLGGMLSVHQRYPGMDLLPLACDMVRMDQRTLEELISIYRKESSSDFYVYRLEGNEFAEPFPGIYCAGALHRVYRHYREGTFPYRSLQKVLRMEGRTRYISAADGDVFANINAL